MSQWATTFSLKKVSDLYWYGNQLVIVDDLLLRRLVAQHEMDYKPTTVKYLIVHNVIQTPNVMHYRK